MFQSVHRGESEARILVMGEAALDQVNMVDTGQTLDLGEERQRAADEVCRRMRESGSVVTADPVYRLLDHHCQDGRLTLTLGQGNYSQIMGMKAHPEWEMPCCVLAMLAVLSCPDGFAIERRSARVAVLPGRLHVVPAGSVSPGETLEQTLVREACEELGLEAHELHRSLCLGLVHVESVGVYLVCCSAQTDVPLEAMATREREGRWEQDELLCAPSHPLKLAHWLERHKHDLTPGARGTLLLEGRRLWGTSWFEEQMEKLR